jgi:hypothetical protein
MMEVLMDTGTIDENQSLMLDGNAMAGLLHDLFDTEMTVAPVECASCGRVGELGSLWAFMESPGYVMRCPDCHNIVIRIAETEEHIYLDARGARYIRIIKHQ